MSTPPARHPPCGGAGGRGVLHHPVLPAGGVADRPSNAVRFADFGLNMPSFGLFANESKLAQRRDAIARFASVSARAWEYIYAGHQDEAVAAILAQRPQSRLDRKVLRGQIDALQPYFGQPAARAWAPSCRRIGRRPSRPCRPWG